MNVKGSSPAAPEALVPDPASGARSVAAHGAEIAEKKRFGFGDNWQRFLRQVDEARILEAERSLLAALKQDTLTGQAFLDVGSGSGLFSLAAYRLGARVVSLDYDPESVACTAEMRRRFAGDDRQWRVMQGSVLDASFMGSLGAFDVVYSWGVLHHTGTMWAAVDAAAGAVRQGGSLLIALYNRQPLLSGYWLVVKRTYNRLPSPLQAVMASGYFAYFALVGGLADLVRGTNPLRRYSGSGRRGMAMYRDTVDWVGGLPFEVASPEEVVLHMAQLGFAAECVRGVGRRHGCNEFLLRRRTS
jgi:2-polyprenyl-6-hydroxyphenyl methylase/3-demethylubiquinone-9 3-methyltransferase